MLIDTLSGKDFARKVGPMTEVEMSETTLVTRSVSARTMGRLGTMDVSMETTSDALFCARTLFVVAVAFLSEAELFASCAYPIGRVVNVAVRILAKIS